MDFSKETPLPSPTTATLSTRAPSAVLYPTPPSVDAIPAVSHGRGNQVPPAARHSILFLPSPPLLLSLPPRPPVTPPPLFLSLSPITPAPEYLFLPTNSHPSQFSQGGQLFPATFQHPWPEWSELVHTLSPAAKVYGIVPEDTFVSYEYLSVEFVRSATSCLAFARNGPNILEFNASPNLISVFV